MPIYETECDICGVLERFYPNATGLDLLPCPGCGKESPRIFSLVSMQPDRFWHNNHVMGSTVKSMREYRELRNRMEPRTENVSDSIGKRRKQLRKEREAKASEKLEKFLANELAPV